MIARRQSSPSFGTAFVAFAALVAGACNDASNGTGSTGGGGAGAVYIPPGGGSNVAATSAELLANCDASCGRQARCGPNGTPVDAGVHCSESCVAKLGNLAKHARADIVRALAACYSALPCGPSDDSCSGTAVTQTGQKLDAAIHAPDVEACLKKQAECKGGPGAFSDDTCGTMLMLVDSARSTTASCFTGACAGIPACLQPIFGK